MAKSLATFERVNGKSVAKQMGKVADSMKDMTVANKKIAIATMAWIQRNFQSEGGKVGGWKDLKESTIAGRRQGSGKGSPKILQDTGALKNEWKMLWTRFRMAIQSQNFYSNIHDQQKEYSTGTGGKGSGKIPQRRILPTQDEAGVYIQKIYDNEYEKKLKVGVNALSSVKGVRKLS